MKLEHLLNSATLNISKGVSYIRNKIKPEYLFYSCYALIPIVTFVANTFVGNPRSIDGCIVREFEKRRSITTGSNLFPTFYVDRDKDGRLDEKYMSAFSRNTSVVLIPQNITPEDRTLYDNILKELKNRK